MNHFFEKILAIFIVLTLVLCLSACDSDEAHFVTIEKQSNPNIGGEISYEQALEKYMYALCEMDFDKLEEISAYITYENEFGYTKDNMEELRESGYELKIKDYKIIRSVDVTNEAIGAFDEEKNLKGSIEEAKKLNVKLTTLWKPATGYEIEEETSEQKVILLKINNRWYMESMINID